MLIIIPNSFMEIAIMSTLDIMYYDLHIILLVCVSKTDICAHEKILSAYSKKLISHENQLRFHLSEHRIIF